MSITLPRFVHLPIGRPTDSTSERRTRIYIQKAGHMEGCGESLAIDHPEITLECCPEIETVEFSLGAADGPGNYINIELSFEDARRLGAILTAFTLSGEEMAIPDLVF